MDCSLVEIKGLEPLTPCVQGRCSPRLSYTPIWWTFRDSNPGPIGYEPIALTS
jgi:hypothetical protein